MASGNVMEAAKEVTDLIKHDAPSCNDETDIDLVDWTYEFKHELEPSANYFETKRFDVTSRLKDEFTNGEPVMLNLNVLFSDEPDISKRFQMYGHFTYYWVDECIVTITFPSNINKSSAGVGVGYVIDPNFNSVPSGYDMESFPMLMDIGGASHNQILRYKVPVLKKKLYCRIAGEYRTEFPGFLVFKPYVPINCNFTAEVTATLMYSHPTYTLETATTRFTASAEGVQIGEVTIEDVGPRSNVVRVPCKFHVPRAQGIADPIAIPIGAVVSVPKGVFVTAMIRAADEEFENTSPFTFMTVREEFQGPLVENEIGAVLDFPWPYIEQMVEPTEARLLDSQVRFGRNALVNFSF